MARQPAPVLAAQVARMFFDRQLSKVEIGRALGISRFRVADLIDEALTLGLVRIEFRDVPPQDRDLALAIERRWELDLCIVASTAESGGLARLAAAAINDLIGSSEVIGIAWGSTLADVVRELPTRWEPGVTVVQLAGSSVRGDRETSAGELVRVLANRLGATPVPLVAPAFVETPELRDALVREPDIRHTIDRFGSLSLAIVGIGALSAQGASSQSSLLREGVLRDEELAAVRAAGAVGDLILNTFDEQGRFVPPNLPHRAIGITAEELRGVGRVVAVAGGAAKAGAIRGALATGIIDILITDLDAARLVGAEG